MTNSITIPSIGKPKTVKDSILSVLINDWPISARKIYLKGKSHGIDVTYQAVHKALGEMIGDEMVSKTDGGYKLNEVWIQRMKDFSNKLDSSYRDRKTGSLENVMTTGYQSFSVETVADLYRFMLDAIAFFKDIYPNPLNPGLAILSHLFWTLLGSENEQKQFKKILSWKEGVNVVCTGNSKADKMLATFYESVKGTRVKVYIGVNCSNDYELIVLEDLVFQMYFPKDIKDILDSFYENFDSRLSENLMKFYDDILFKKTKVIINIIRNQNLTEMIRSNISLNIKRPKI